MDIYVYLLREQRNDNCWENSGKLSSLGNEDMCTPRGEKPAHSVGEDAKQESSSLFHSPERKETERERDGTASQCYV